MAIQSNQDTIDLDRELARTAAIGLAVWVGITLAVVALLMLSGDVLTSLFV